MSIKLPEGRNNIPTKIPTIPPDGFSPDDIQNKITERFAKERAEIIKKLSALLVIPDLPPTIKNVLPAGVGAKVTQIMASVGIVSAAIAAYSPMLLALLESGGACGNQESGPRDKYKSDPKPMD